MRVWARQLSVLCACDAQTGGAYQGEPLGSMHGEITSRLTTPLADGAHLALVWNQGLRAHGRRRPRIS